MEIGIAFAEGARKYGSHNYRAIGVRASTYYDAALRHIMSWWEGEDIDPDSGVPHIAKAIACLIIVRDAELMNNFTDDRPWMYPNGLNIDKANDNAKNLLAKYPTCILPYTEDRKKEA